MHSSDFSTLYHTSYSHIYQLVFSVGKNRQSAEDTVQEIYLAAWLRFRGDTHPNPLGWLILTARHKACDMLRRQMRESQRCISLDMQAEYTALSTGLFVTDDIISDEEPYSRIRSLLKPDEFDLLIAHYDHGLPIAELARRLQISASACYMRLHRARQKLSVLIADTSNS